jgi:hypothetical protein
VAGELNLRSTNCSPKAKTEIPHQLAGVLKARQIADLGQHRHCRNEIYPAHRLQGGDDLGKGALGHRVTDSDASVARCPSGGSAQR